MRRSLALPALAAAAALGLAGCGGSGAAPGPEAAAGPSGQATHRPIRDRELAIMPLPHDVAVADAPGLALAKAESGFSDNVQAAHDTLDPDDTPGQIAATGRERSYSATFRDDSFSALREGRGLLEAGTGVTLFRTDGEAHAWVARQAAAYERLRGREVAAAVTLLDSRPFAPRGIGDEATGTVSRFRVGTAQAWTTVLEFRVGRLVGEVVLTRGDPRDVRRRAEDLAHALDRRIGGVLADRVHDAPAAGRTLPGPSTATPPEGKPDLSARALQPADLPAGARVSAEGYGDVAGGVAAFRRSFDVGAARIGSARVFAITAGVELYGSRDDADRALLDLARAYTSPRAPALLAQVLGAPGAAARLAAARSLSGAGDAAFALQADLPGGLAPTTGVVVLVAAGPAIGELVVTGSTGRLRIADVAPLARKLAERLASGSPQKHVAL